MTNLNLYAIASIIIFTSCNIKSNDTKKHNSIDKVVITKTVDSLYSAYNTKNYEQYMSLLDDEGVYCGTDSKDQWNKSGYAKVMESMFADSLFTPDIKVNNRTIHISKTGTAAIIIDHFNADWSRNLPIRNLFHLVKIDNNWKIDFSSITFVPNNEDISKILNAIETDSGK